MKSHAESLACCTHLSVQLMRSPGFSLPIPIPGLRNYESATDDLGDSRVPESHYSLHRVLLSDAVALDFPWVSLDNALTLTHLVIHLKRADTPAGLTPFLSECRALKYLSLVLHGFHGFHAESEVSLPSLESLHLEGYVSERFCAAIKAPQLKQLRMDTEMPSGDLSPTLISFPFLEHLETSLTPFTENDTLLDLIPRLSMLWLIRVTELDLHHFLSVLDALTEHATSWTLNQSKDQSWLHLRSLEISLQLHSDVWAGLRSGLLLAIKWMYSILVMTPSNEGLPHNDVLVYGPLPEREVSSLERVG